MGRADRIIATVCALLLAAGLYLAFAPEPDPNPSPVRFVPTDLPPARLTPYPGAPASCKDTLRKDIPRGDPDYAPWLDGDQDGLACESRPPRY